MGTAGFAACPPQDWLVSRFQPFPASRQWSVWRLQGPSAGQLQPPVRSRRHRSTGTSHLQSQTHLQVTLHTDVLVVNEQPGRGVMRKAWLSPDRQNFWVQLTRGRGQSPCCFFTFTTSCCFSGSQLMLSKPTWDQYVSRKTSEWIHLGQSTR